MAQETSSVTWTPLCPAPPLLLTIPVVQIDSNQETDPKGIEERRVACLVAYQAAIDAWMNAEGLHTTVNGAAHLYDAIDFAMRLFHAENVTGELSDAESEFYSDVLGRFHFGADVDNRFVQRLLTSDGEMPSPCVRYAALLLACVTLTQSKTWACDPVWAMRTAFRHQLCLVHRSHSIFLRLASSMEALEAKRDSLTPETLVEMGHVQNYYHRRDLAAQNFAEAATRSGLKLKESAMMGVRTRWQQHQHVQAYLHAKSARSPSPCSPDDILDAPKSIGSESAGHDLLDRPRETADGAVEELSPLTALDKAITLGLCNDIKNQNPHHGLTAHHMQIYVERLIADPAPSPFIIRSHILLMRSRLEHSRSRVAERSYLQLCEIVDQFSSAIRSNQETRTLHRADSKYFYLVAFPMIWTLQSEFGSLCMEEELHKTALDVFEKIQDWEKIIQCCRALDKRKKAENLARDLLEKDPMNPLLLVALGEATREDKYLWQAWEVSGHKSAAPMRALAKLAFEREQYEKVIEYFEAAVAINPIFGGDWFTLGFASLRMKNYERSGAAFTRVCQMDPNDAFAWNNLASVMLQLGKKRPAFNAMSQALRNNRRSWRMWQNYFSIGVELNEIIEATHALSVAVEIAKRDLKPESSSMRLFVDGAIRYMKGEIDGRTTTADPTDDLDHCALAGDANDDDMIETSDLKPLAFDVEMPESFFPDKERKEKSAQMAQQAAVIERYTTRLRTLFVQLLDLHVTDAELYACAASLYRYLDGPEVAFEYRNKELRCLEQTPQWNRNEESLQRVLQCFRSMREDFDSLSASESTRPVAKRVGEALIVHADGALHEAGEYLDHSQVFRDVMVLRKQIAQAVKALA